MSANKPVRWECQHLGTWQHTRNASRNSSPFLLQHQALESIAVANIPVRTTVCKCVAKENYSYVVRRTVARGGIKRERETENATDLQQGEQEEVCVMRDLGFGVATQTSHIWNLG